MRFDLLKKFLQTKKFILMDGAMGTEILNRGVKTTLPLWSAEALLTNPQIVQQIHEEYIKAGAEIIITNTFSTTRRMFGKVNIDEKAKEATILACQLAQKARKATKSEDHVLIAGSVAPLEDCYSPELTPPEKELKEEHQELVNNLKEGGVDFILAETMITIRETLAALEAAKKAGLPVAVSFCCNNKEQLLSGESLADAIKAVEPYDPLFIGVNCVSLAIATKTVKALQKLTKRPTAVYAQGDGIPDNDQGWKFTQKELENAYLKEAEEWKKSGALVIGGCCGTTPHTTKSLQETLL